MNNRYNTVRNSSLLDQVIAAYKSDVDGLEFLPASRKSGHATLGFTLRLDHVDVFFTELRNFDKLDVTELLSRTAQLNWDAEGNANVEERWPKSKQFLWAAGCIGAYGERRQKQQPRLVSTDSSLII